MRRNRVSIAGTRRARSSLPGRAEPRSKCDPIPVPHRGGDADHNKCADKVARSPPWGTRRGVSPCAALRTSAASSRRTRARHRWGSS
ncbi:DUF6310 domain-containing protein [Archangium gephyra]|uniref:DUF6310 domain-containing protein n=1 Tax=Archangium gephyra TaxID=48 RepID=UPI003B7A74DA